VSPIEEPKTPEQEDRIVREWEELQRKSREQSTTEQADDYFQDWTCMFPGKMGLSWKRAWDGVGSKEEAEAQARRIRDVGAIRGIRHP